MGFPRGGKKETPSRKKKERFSLGKERGGKKGEGCLFLA